MGAYPQLQQPGESDERGDQREQLVCEGSALRGAGGHLFGGGGNDQRRGLV